jgi:hypothetical protein
MGPIVQGLFLDVPRVIDYAWRHAEYRLNAECAHTPRGIDPKTQKVTQGIGVRAFYKKPAFWFFAITVYFASFGPSWGGLCAIAPQSVLAILRRSLAAVIGIGSVILSVVLAYCVYVLIRERFAQVRSHSGALPFLRRATCCTIIYLGWALLPAGGVALGTLLWVAPAGGLVCVLDECNRTAILRLVMCVASIALFAWLTSRDDVYAWLATRLPRCKGRFRFDVIVQLLLLVIVALIQWFLLSTGKTREASELPYRHVFLLWAPSIAFVIAFAPWWAGRRFRGADALAPHFRGLLQRTELFVQPVDPELSWRSIIYAVFFAPINHILQLLLFPALVAIAVPEDWLNFSVAVAFGLSFCLVVWGNMSPRWREVNTYIERWFLRGAPLLITSLVIGIAILRLARFEYVSTLLDAIPFGTVFGLIVMNYVLFWLAEYWMSRAAALELLRLLPAEGEEPLGETYIRYVPHPTEFPKNANVHVDRDERYLAIHGTGRFVVLGNVVNVCAQRCRAFQSYYLTETFAVLDPDKDSNSVAEVVQRTGTYFLGLNIALILVAALFWGINAYGQADLVVHPVVLENHATQPADLVDLSKLLQQAPGPDRPAIVVVGSGGGTRAALYTESVLRGLHRLGVDRDVVLVSGVSGGGVALAYFAANMDALTRTGAVAPSSLCPDNPGPAHSDQDEWGCFQTAVTKPFIEDVLNGATEWRIFTKTALSALLAESFDRDLFDKRPLGSVSKAALILNATIVSHPAEASALLTKTLNTPTTCDQAEQVFKLMSGGRLIFTNLRDVDAFERDGPDPSLPDVRLPYHVVRDPTVPLAAAAALNANFPPVFPAARVRERDDASARCPNRSFYVTDGGAEENLGLISALYAIESALEKLKASGGHARPIHIVIAEASALDYDYSQDRAISLLLGGGPSTRLASGLTRELRGQVDAQLTGLNGAPTAVRYHFLGLPLAFRARGGFGTHWLFANSFTLEDPRGRKVGSLASILGSGKEQITIDRATLEDLWSALHDPKTPFCSAKNFKDEKAFKVQSWICGPAQGDEPGRDLHMAAWQELLDDMSHYQKP